MNINIKTTNYEMTPETESQAGEVLAHIQKFIREDNDTEALAEVEIEGVETRRNSNNVYRAEINLTVNGTLYRAESTRRSLQNALNDVKQELSKEIRRAKDKRGSFLRRGGRKAKEVLRGFGRRSDG